MGRESCRPTHWSHCGCSHCHVAEESWECALHPCGHASCAGSCTYAAAATLTKQQPLHERQLPAVLRVGGDRDRARLVYHAVALELRALYDVEDNRLLLADLRWQGKRAMRQNRPCFVGQPRDVASSAQGASVAPNPSAPGTGGCCSASIGCSCQLMRPPTSPGCPSERATAAPRPASAPRRENPPRNPARRKQYSRFHRLVPEPGDGCPRTRAGRMSTAHLAASRGHGRRAAGRKPAPAPMRWQSCCGGQRCDCQGHNPLRSSRARAHPRGCSASRRWGPSRTATRTRGHQEDERYSFCRTQGRGPSQLADHGGHDCPRFLERGRR